MTDQEVLDRAGRFIAKIRDDSIDEWDRTLAGKMLADDAQEIFSRVRSFSPEQMETLRWLLPQVVDSVLYDVLFAIESNEEFRLVAKTGEDCRDLAKISDGLATELQTKDGWIVRFSRARKTTEWAR